MRVASALVLILGIIVFMVGVFGVVIFSLMNKWPGTLWSILAIVVGAVMVLVSLLIFALDQIME